MKKVVGASADYKMYRSTKYRGVEKWSSRRPHEPKIAGSNPASPTTMQLGGMATRCPHKTVVLGSVPRAATMIIGVRLGRNCIVERNINFPTHIYGTVG